ncbi:rRNA maturation RNase YbeY [Candidatus Peregrinibacteria bacterium]|nr:MAG: rRNA maturation RNase YbeY [Candidatus Peregrinibacteria bacterium]
MKITFINHQEWGIEPRGFEDIIKRFETYLPVQTGDLNVVFVNDVYIQSLNKAYRGKDQPTDVLSFPYLDAPDFELTRLIGEIYISVETTRRQAEQFGHSFDFELRKLLVHGVCHVYGYDHIEEEDYIKMHAIECQLLDFDLPFIPRESAEKL